MKGGSIEGNREIFGLYFGSYKRWLHAWDGCLKLAKKHHGANFTLHDGF